MDIIKELENMRKRILQEINTEFDILIEQMSASEEISPVSVPAAPYEISYPLTAGGKLFKGKKPSSVRFGGEAPINIFTWKQLVETVMTKCISVKTYRDKLYSLCGKVSGKKRTLLSDKSEGMRSPIKIADGIFMEAHYDTETLISILITKILIPIGYDYSSIQVTVINK